MDDRHLSVAVSCEPPPSWDGYVEAQPAARAYHCAGWPAAAADIFRLESYYLVAKGRAGVIEGVLPLVRQRSRLFGDRLTSLPFFNYGGPLADSDGVRAALVERAVDLAAELRVGRVELRDTSPAPAGWSCRTDKATLLLALPPTVEGLFKDFGSKLRSQIRRAEREPREVKVGGGDRVADFYPVFAEVMRDLGTPVYPRRFFEELTRRLPEFCTILTIHRDGRPVSAAFLVGYRNTLEIPWAATVAAEKPRSTNMLLYAEVLKLAVERGYSTFDFGRSTIDSGPYRFKLQWGAKPVPLHWAVWPAEAAATAANAGPTLRDRATRVWSRLPLGVANRLGPLISPSLPW